MKVWNRAGVELETPGSAVRHASVVRHLSTALRNPVRSGPRSKPFDKLIAEMKEFYEKLSLKKSADDNRIMKITQESKS